MWQPLHFTQFHSEEIPRKMHCIYRPLGEFPKKIEEMSKKKIHWETRQNFPWAMNKYKMCIKIKKYKIYKLPFPSDILQKVNVNQMKPTWSMFFAKSSRILIRLPWFNTVFKLFSELHFFILFGTISKIFVPKYLIDWIP